MSEDDLPVVPLGDAPVPDKVLEELLAAFAGDEDLATDEMPIVPDVPTAGQRVDLDDPAIDALLGITADEPAAPAPDETTLGEPAHDGRAVDGPAVEQLPGDDQAIVVTAPVPETPAQPTALVDPADPADPEPVVLNPILLDPGLAEPASPPSSPGEAEAGEAAPAGPLAPPARRTIRIGGDDDGAMDPVYLDEEGAGRLRGETDRQTEASVERTTIFIGDDDLDGASGGIPIATGSASIDPRLRARRIAVKRALGRKRLKWVVLAVVVVLLITSVLALLGSSLFRVQQIEVSGRSGTTNEAIEAAVAELKDTPVLLVDTHAIEEQLERSPWIREARVATDFPHGASIEVVERVPLATYPGTDGRWRIIDVEGVVLTVIANRPLAFMEIEGPGADAEAGGSAGQALRHAAELVEALTPAVRSRTQKVLVDPTGELRLQFADTTVELGAAENLLDKLTWLEVVIKSGRVDDCSVVNVTTRDVGCVPAR